MKENPFLFLNLKGKLTTLIFCFSQNIFYSVFALSFFLSHQVDAFPLKLEGGYCITYPIPPTPGTPVTLEKCNSSDDVQSSWFLVDVIDPLPGNDGAVMTCINDSMCVGLAEDGTEMLVSNEMTDTSQQWVQIKGSGNRYYNVQAGPSFRSNLVFSDEPFVSHKVKFMKCDQ